MAQAILRLPSVKASAGFSRSTIYQKSPERNLYLAYRLAREHAAESNPR